MQHQQYLTRAEAADACGVSIDTLRRDERDGKLSSRKRSDGLVEYAASDLVAIGRLVPAALGGELTDLLQERRALRERDDARRQLAAAEERLEAANARLAAQAEEIGFLRTTVANLTKRVA